MNGRHNPISSLIFPLPSAPSIGRGLAPRLNPAPVSRSYTYMCPGCKPAEEDVTDAVYAAASRFMIGNIGGAGAEKRGIDAIQLAIREASRPKFVTVVCPKGHECEYTAPEDARTSQ